MEKARLHFTFRPFAQTEVDFAGPQYTVQGRRKPWQKRWLSLFTCLGTRAVHLEMAWGQDTDTLLNAFTRLTSRRVPKEVITDRHEFHRCSGWVKETSQPVRQTETWEQDSWAWRSMEVQPTSCSTFWRSPWSDGESFWESHLYCCTRPTCDWWEADHIVCRGEVSS